MRRIRMGIRLQMLLLVAVGLSGCGPRPERGWETLDVDPYLLSAQDTDGVWIKDQRLYVGDQVIGDEPTSDEPPSDDPIGDQPASEGEVTEFVKYENFSVTNLDMDAVVERMRAVRGFEGGRLPESFPTGPDFPTGPEPDFPFPEVPETDLPPMPDIPVPDGGAEGNGWVPGGPGGDCLSCYDDPEQGSVRYEMNIEEMMEALDVVVEAEDVSMNRIAGAAVASLKRSGFAAHYTLPRNIHIDAVRKTSAKLQINAAIEIRNFTVSYTVLYDITPDEDAEDGPGHARIKKAVADMIAAVKTEIEELIVDYFTP